MNRRTTASVAQAGAFAQGESAFVRFRAGRWRPTHFGRAAAPRPPGTRSMDTARIDGYPGGFGEYLNTQCPDRIRSNRPTASHRLREVAMVLVRSSAPQSMGTLDFRHSISLPSDHSHRIGHEIAAPLTWSERQIGLLLSFTRTLTRELLQDATAKTRAITNPKRRNIIMLRSQDSTPTRGSARAAGRTGDREASVGTPRAAALRRTPAVR